MAIFTRREEIEIMKLVGATPWFIRGPFIVEAALYGIIAALVSVVLFYGLVTAGAPRLSGYISIDPVLQLFRTSILPMLLIEMVIGVAVGAFSSLLAMSRYLKLS
jgi:cell division transport system permease protein